MHKNYSVIDKGSAYESGYLKLVFFRRTTLVDKVSLIRWVQLTIVEMIVGYELLESFLITASVPSDFKDREPDNEDYGKPMHLRLHIPMGLVNKRLKPYILEVLYYKYYLQYLMIEPVQAPKRDELTKTINCTRTRFRAKKSMFYQLIYFRRVYDLTWLLTNVCIDLAVYLSSSDINLAIISALLVEGFRRLIKI